MLWTLWGNEINSCGVHGCGVHLVRLAGSPVPYDGRLEVLHDGEWGAVCENHFTDEAAQVACNMLGFG